MNGIFESRTESAVRAFQRSRRITADGIVGSQTWSRLYGPTPSPVPSPPSGTTSVTWALPPKIQAAGDAQTVRYDSPPAWANGANCTSYTDRASELRRHILATFPGVDAIGGFNCRAKTANSSETSVRGVGRALDIMIRPIGGRANSAVGDPIANWLVPNAAAIGVQYIIWNRVRWSGSRSSCFATYTGPNPHVDHIHVELNLDGVRRTTPWFNSCSKETYAKLRDTAAINAGEPERSHLMTSTAASLRIGGDTRCEQSCENANNSRWATDMQYGQNKRLFKVNLHT